MPAKRLRASLLHEVDPVSRLEAERAAQRLARQEVTARLRLARKRKSYADEALMRGLSPTRWAIVAYFCILCNMSSVAADKYCELWAYNDPQSRGQLKATSGAQIRDRLVSRGATTVESLQLILGAVNAGPRILL